MTGVQTCALPIYDPRWHFEIENSHKLLAEETATRLAFPICFALNAIGTDAVACKTQRDKSVCERMLARLQSEPEKLALWTRTQSIFDTLPLLAKTRFRASCVSTSP